MTAKLVTFIDWTNWIYVRNAIFDCYDAITDCSPNVSYRFEIVQKVVEMWRSRGKPPHSADSTAQILEILYRDNFQKIVLPFFLLVWVVVLFIYNFTCMQSVSELELQLLYSMVIVRTVNGLTDCNQEGVYANSVISVAERIGLPAWIVELRHESTHNQLPSISVLRSAAHYLMGWFRTYYWDPQLNRLEELSRCCIGGTNQGNLKPLI